LSSYTLTENVIDSSYLGTSNLNCWMVKNMKKEMLFLNFVFRYNG